MVSGKKTAGKGGGLGVKKLATKVDDSVFDQKPAEQAMAKAVAVESPAAGAWMRALLLTLLALLWVLCFACAVACTDPPTVITSEDALAGQDVLASFERQRCMWLHVCAQLPFASKGSI